MSLTKRNLKNGVPETMKSKIRTVFRTKTGKRVSLAYKGFKRAYVYKGKKLTYRSRFYKRGKTFWSEKVHVAIGFVKVTELKKLTAWKKTFTWGRFQDVKTKFFYNRQSDLKKKFNMAVGYFSVLIYPHSKKSRRVVLTKKLSMYPATEKRDIMTWRKLIKAHGIEQLEFEGKESIKFVGFTALNWHTRQKKGRDIFTQRIIPYIKTLKKKNARKS